MAVGSIVAAGADTAAVGVADNKAAEAVVGDCRVVVGVVVPLAVCLLVINLTDSTRVL